MLLGGSFRGAARCVARRRARRESFFCFRESSAEIKACVCARAARPATRCGLDENEYCAALYGVTLPYGEPAAAKLESCFG